MIDVRAKNQGTWDRTTGCWRVKHRKIQKSPSQLANIFNTQVPNTKEGSRPFWNRFLASIEQQQQEVRKRQSPLQERIRSLETLISQFREEKRPCEDLEAELRRCINIPSHDTDTADIPVLHPDMKTVAAFLGEDEFITRLLNSLAPKPIPKAESLQAEVDAFIERHKAKGHKGWYSVKTALDLFTQATGKIRLQDITVQHYRKFIELVNAYATWGERSKANAQRCINTFLKRLGADHNISYGFIRNPEYQRSVPDGQRLQYTIEEVKTALQQATGINRTALLLGLNCGFYWGDMTELQEKHFDGNRINKGRAKNNHKKTKIVGSWLLWEDTKKHLQYGLTKLELQREWMKFMAKHSLPEHKALRKTVAQWIHDHVGEEEARLYRCEKGNGTHHTNYIKPFSPAQMAKLDKALMQLAKLLGLTS